jgi:hypothetical protein
VKRNAENVASFQDTPLKRVTTVFSWLEKEDMSDMAPGDHPLVTVNLGGKNALLEKKTSREKNPIERIL